jgi:hypothetical protein
MFILKGLINKATTQNPAGWCRGKDPDLYCEVLSSNLYSDLRVLIVFFIPYR